MSAKHIQKAICLAVFFLLVHQAWAEDWIYYDTNSVGDMYYNKSRMKEVSKSITSVLTKNVLCEEAKIKYFSILKSIGKAPPEPSMLRYYTELLEIDHVHKRIKNISVTFYSEKHTVLYASPKSVSGEWNVILSGSVGEKLLERLYFEPVIPAESFAYTPDFTLNNIPPINRNQIETTVVPKEAAPHVAPKVIDRSKPVDRETFRHSENAKLSDEKNPLAMENHPIVPLRVTARDGRFIAYNNQTVLDSSTSLMWAAKDNGSDINWQDAKNYCENYRGGGYTDWRMPTANELAELYDRNNPKHQACYSKYEIYLTNLIDLSCCCPWASETSDSEAASFNFDHGRRYWDPQSSDVNKWYRVLPVRQAR